MTPQEIREAQRKLRQCEAQLLAAEDHNDIKHYKLWLKLRNDIARQLEQEFSEET